ncbi:MAG: DUF4097 family beta strand repeat-containing protein [Bacteroidota bacterium]
MKTKNYKHYALVFILILFTGFTIKAAEDEYSKKIHKEYETNEQTHLNLTNKYGDVEITNWEKNSIVIDVTITVDHKKEDKAKDLLENISVDFSQDGNTINVETEIDKNFNKSNWFFNFSSNDKQFSIDYEIKMPKSLQLTLANKYGDVFIDEVTGQADIAVKYGNLKANKILRDNTKPLSRVNLGYSDGTIKEANWLKLNLKYSKLEIDKSTALMAVTKYSKLYTEEASSIVAESKYDNYYLGEISNLVVESKYTDYEVDQLNKQLDIDTKYGDLEIDYIHKSFEKLWVNNKYGHIDLKIDKAASYNIEGEAEYGDISYPDSQNINRRKDNTELEISGIIGRAKNPKAKVNLKTKYGDIDLK